MPANLIVAVVLLAVEALKAYRAKQERETSEHDNRGDYRQGPTR